MRTSSDVDDLDSLSPRERMLRAKVEHYIEQAEECIRMSRLKMAGRYVEKVLALDPANAVCRDLRGAIEDRYLRLSGKTGGAGANGSNGQGAVGRRRREEVVLIVDQDEQVLSSLTDALQRYGFATLGAAGYEEALEVLALFEPDAVISEVNFETGPMGVELYQWVRTNITERDVPFVFLAARIDRETLIAGKRFGVDDFLQKPVDAEVILASIVNCLSRRRSLTQTA